MRISIRLTFFLIDFADIKLMMKHKLEEKESPSGEVEKQLGLLDLLFEHRLQHIDASVIREEASKCKCKRSL